jgi:hypothetical protein
MSDLTLRIKPVKLKQSVYLRVPNDIVDLIGVESDSEVIMSLEEQDDRFLLIYSVRKSVSAEGSAGYTRFSSNTKEHLLPLQATLRSAAKDG